MTGVDVWMNVPFVYILLWAISAGGVLGIVYGLKLILRLERKMLDIEERILKIEKKLEKEEEKELKELKKLEKEVEEETKEK
jgi:hypothetical protein